VADEPETIDNDTIRRTIGGLTGDVNTGPPKVPEAERKGDLTVHSRERYKLTVRPKARPTTPTAQKTLGGPTRPSCMTAPG
jgi:hypothetical protein